MSDKVDIGDLESLEDSLPSWISEHLGERSYMDDKGETILSTRTSEVAFYETVFSAGLRFPIHPTISSIGATFPSMNSGAFIPCSKVQGQTRGDDWEFSSSIVRGEVLQVPRSWGIQCFTLARAEMSSSGRDHAKDKPIKEEIGAVGNEGESRHSEMNFTPMIIPEMTQWMSPKSAPAAKGMVIGGKHPREEASNVSLSEAKSKGKKALLPSTEKKRKSATSSTSPVTKGAKPALAPELTELEMVQAQNRTIDLERIMAEFAVQEKKASDELKAKSDALARLEEEVAELKKNEALAKKKAVEEYKASKDFQEAVENASSKYFGEGFDFCKRQLARHHPNLGIDLDNMGLGHDLLEEEEAEEREREEKEENKKGEESPFSLNTCIYIYFGTGDV
ncbi:hypothetical protein Acr_14g0006880 [Actinidia rufa]|uniref:Uncharacterized protein n=1 Tax=Actinidia rufa TaxID=165716 RepID=A0A7J0FQQ2_9ERIC|nr:hypothetical protein Acr_14g0006880 [Actinidia rufa]